MAEIGWMAVRSMQAWGPLSYTRVMQVCTTSNLPLHGQLAVRQARGDDLSRLQLGLAWAHLLHPKLAPDSPQKQEKIEKKKVSME
jgi:hypothetical protein